MGVLSRELEAEYEKCWELFMWLPALYDEETLSCWTCTKCMKPCNAALNILGALEVVWCWRCLWVWYA